MMNTESNEPVGLPANTPKENRVVRHWIYDVLLIYVLLVGIYLRTVGINWGEDQYLHPDERFLVWVGADTSPVNSLADYFNTPISTLNPHNVGHGFYVYGTLPLFMARYLVQWIYGHSGFNEMTQVGRPLSALMDLLTLLTVYLIAKELYNRKAAVLAAAFYACAALPIQLSHYYKEDTFLNFFTYLAIYFAVQAFTTHARWPEMADTPKNFIRRFITSGLFWPSLGFGIALGCAVSSKLNAAPVALILPAAFSLRLLREEHEAPLPGGRRQRMIPALLYLGLAALVSLFVFRVCQPYAFSGPGFFGVKPNPAWVANIRELQNQSTGDVDFPPALQWARRSVLFSGQNLTVWGLGLPLGILAWLGFLLAGWRMLKGDWQRHALLWGWTAFYFAWQSLQFNPTMRYQLPSYPGLCIFAGWVVFWLAGERLNRRISPAAPTEELLLSDDSLALPQNDDIVEIEPSREYQEDEENKRPPAWQKWSAYLVGGLVLALSFAWAYAFTRIYTRPVTRIAASRWIYQNVPGPIDLHIQAANSTYNEPLPFPEGQTLRSEAPYATIFDARASGTLQEISLAHVMDLSGSPEAKQVELALSRVDGGKLLASATISATFNTVNDDARGAAYLVKFPSPVKLDKGTQYSLALKLSGGNGELSFSGASPANESTWDDGLPLRMDGYDGYGGIYTSGLVFEMYWDDDTQKLTRFLDTLDRSDYIFISSNRQWGTTTRVPERYPLTSAYYRHLLGCPAEKDILWCYRVAEPGMFKGDLGFDLVQVFESYPNLGSFQINDQFAEEAFTVYDHPKVLIFRKNSNFSTDTVSSILGNVDISHVVHVTPRQTKSRPANLLLPLARWAVQRAGGTWAQLFNPNALINRSQPLAAIAWYLCLWLLGVVAYPVVRLGFAGLSDRGYPLARTVGLLLLSYVVWLAGSYNVPFSRATIAVALIGLLLLSGILAYRSRHELRQELGQRWKYFLLVEGLFLAFFLFDLFIRLGNPDLWHPWKGGEKPMDFSYFNAVLKSTSFPPYDPWYAGGYLNYYYYGFVFVGVLVKFLGITPAVAYNLIIPTMFSMIAIGAFCLGWNLYRTYSEQFKIDVGHCVVGIFASLGMAVFGSLGTVRMIFQGYEKLAAPGGVIEGAGLLTRWVWAAQGFARTLGGASLPYGIGDWYWIPSRAIPAPNEVEPITEFPFFTVLYGDPHAHLFALPITLLALAFALSVLSLGKRWKERLVAGVSIFLGSLAVGVLRPTNTFDLYAYLPLGCVVLFYALWTGWPFDELSAAPRRNILGSLPQFGRRLLIASGGTLLFAVLSQLLFYPYTLWFGMGYNRIELWQGTHTPSTSYFVHWGLFLFLIVSWMTWETRDWMATTPLSALRKLEPYKGTLWGVVALLLVTTAGLLFYGISIAWFVLPVAVWAGVLLLRPNQSAARRLVLFLVGTGLVLTLVVELIHFVGDVGRMNTVFKIYLQVWTLFAISAAAGLGWLLGALPTWRPRYRAPWQAALALLVAGAGLYTIMAGVAKVKDRMVDAEHAPHTLDGMAYMAYAQYADVWGTMDLSQDYRAIRWMQENVPQSPVIVEANLRDLYRWGSRFTVYTGLPGVVGWEYHQQQQRALLPSIWVSDRIQEIDNFYTTTDLQVARDFLRKYQVGYIIVGQQERGHYPGPGLEKFTEANGALWKEVYRDQATVIYQVLP